MLGAGIQHALKLQLAQLSGVHNRGWQAVKERVGCLRELDVAAQYESNPRSADHAWNSKTMPS